MTEFQYNKRSTVEEAMSISALRSAAPTDAEVDTPLRDER
jgi:hypothetical protein